MATNRDQVLENYIQFLPEECPDLTSPAEVAAVDLDALAFEAVDYGAGQDDIDDGPEVGFDALLVFTVDNGGCQVIGVFSEGAAHEG